MTQKETLLNLNERIGELCRNVKRKKIIAIAKELGWEIVPAGKERLKARRQGYASVSIPGSNDSSIIAYGTAYKVVKLLFEPSLTQSKRTNHRDHLGSPPSSPDSEKLHILEHQLAQANQVIVQLNADVEAGIELAAETEKHNHELHKKVHQYTCWIEGLKHKMANLIHQRVQQETEMLTIADAVEQREIRIQSSAVKLAEFSQKLKPNLRQELKQIVRYLTEES